MKNLHYAVLILAACFISTSSFGQLAAVKKFDYSLLEGKVLYIPTYEASKKYVQRMNRKGKFDKAQAAKDIAESYNEAWKQAMAESSYDATDYEIKSVDLKKLVKNKDKKALVLYYSTDDFGNRSAMLVAAGPKRRVIARTIITGLFLGEKNDIRLMMNMLNESLTVASEIDGEGGKVGYKNIRSKYKEKLVEWHSEVKDKTFLIPKSTHKNAKKAANRNADLKAALRTWKLSKYDFTTYDEVEAKRIEGDPDSYYWRSFRIYTQSPLISYNYNLILSTDGDDIIMAFLGKKRLKPATLEQIQKKIAAKVERYKKQLAK